MSNGRAISLWPLFDRHTGQLNHVEGYRLAAMRIISAILIRQEEDFIHPDYGRAPWDLFVPLSQAEPHVLVYQLEQILVNQVGDCLEGLNVKVTGYNAIDPALPGEGLAGQLLSSVSPHNNRLNISVFFRTGGRPHELVFPFWRYQGEPFDLSNIANVIRDVSLDGKPFLGLNNGQ